MIFDEYAKNWDTEKRIKRAKIISNEIANSIGNEKTYTALEFGCGTGLISFNLLNKFKKITLVDSSKGMIDILNVKIDNYRVSNMDAKHLDKASLNSIGDRFDVIYSSMVLHHIHDIKTVIKDFYELLNNNGYLCIVDLNEEDGSFHKKEPGFDGHNGFNQEVLKSILSSAGFDCIESKTFYYDQKVVENVNVNYSLFLINARKHVNV